MENNKLGQEPAFPIIEERYDGVSQVFKQECVDAGMSKRFYAACCAMQGLLANESGFYINETETTKTSLPNKARFAFMCADEILKQENL